MHEMRGSDKRQTYLNLRWSSFLSIMMVLVDITLTNISDNLTENDDIKMSSVTHQYDGNLYVQMGRLVSTKHVHF